MTNIQVRTKLDPNTSNDERLAVAVLLVRKLNHRIEQLENTVLELRNIGQEHQNILASAESCLNGIDNCAKCENCKLWKYVLGGNICQTCCDYYCGNCKDKAVATVCSGKNCKNLSVCGRCTKILTRTCPRCNGRYSNYYM